MSCRVWSLRRRQYHNCNANGHGSMIIQRFLFTSAVVCGMVVSQYGGKNVHFQRPSSRSKEVVVIVTVISEGSVNFILLQMFSHGSYHLLTHAQWPIAS